MQTFGFYSYKQEKRISMHSMMEKSHRRGSMYTNLEGGNVIVTEVISHTTEKDALEYFKEYKSRLPDGEFRGEVFEYVGGYYGGVNGYRPTSEN